MKANDYLLLITWTTNSKPSIFVGTLEQLESYARDCTAETGATAIIYKYDGCLTHIRSVWKDGRPDC